MHYVTRVLLCGVLFFFQAEDGIRDHCVTGVQTCALPISFLVKVGDESSMRPIGGTSARGSHEATPAAGCCARSRSAYRSEERRVGKECRSRWSRSPEKEEEEQGVGVMSREEVWTRDTSLD